MGIGAALLGTGRAVSDFGAQVAEADESNASAAARAAAAQQAAAAREAAAAEKRREFDLKQQQVNAKRPLGTPYTVGGGKVMQRFYDPATRTVTAEEVKAPAPETQQEAYVRAMMAIGATKDQAMKMAQDKYGPARPKPTAAEEEYDMHVRLYGKAMADRMEKIKGGVLPRARTPGAGGAGAGGGSDQADIEWWAQQVKSGAAGLAQVPPKIKQQVAHQMRLDNATPPKKLPAAAQTALLTIEPAISQTNQLLADIERLGLQNNNTPGYLAKANLKYKLGVKSPTGSLGSDIANLQLTSLTSAASVLRGVSRAQPALNLALQHTPNIWVDSPALIYSKLKTINARMKDVTEEARTGAVQGAGTGGGAVAGAIDWNSLPEVK